MNYRIEIKWGVIYIVITLLWAVMEKSVGLRSQYISLQPLFSTFVIIPSVIIYFLALNDKKKNFYNGSITYKQAFITGFYVTLIIAILSPIAQYISTSVISPEYFTNIIRYTVKQGKMTQQDAVKFYSLFYYMFFSFISTLVIGTIISSIVSAFVKNKKSHFG